MKKLKITLFFWLILFTLHGQDRNINKKVFVTTNKTTFLIFNSEIDFFDYGSKEVGVEMTEKPNILKLKATARNIRETNLTVLTKDEQFYSILVNYKETPDTLNYFFKSDKQVTNKNGSNFQPTADPEKKVKSEFENNSEEIIKLSKKQTPITGGRQGDVIALVKGVFIKDDKIYVLIGFVNQSSINYDFDFIKFYIRTKARLKKASAQDTQIDPIFTSNNGEFLKLGAHGKEENNQVFVFEKFTIPKQKEFVIDIGEKNGERNLKFDLPGSAILSAKKF
ncbi:DUF4138 domain-containing protein [Pedobacter jeongneungensis]|uniref:DUF4138 domain-containing protein n=1 Tax=Pedobacter jeongneungensis TaxID=947309 RepID=UPI0004686934|nr:DUF4138 domain-containing protein [Pedobacter jeongneungensis]